MRRFAVPLRLIYLCGLRLSEALHIEVRDIHRKDQRLHIRESSRGRWRGAETDCEGRAARRALPP